ncbi:hypothetical protein [Mycoplasma sp. Sp33II]|uniref:hypothetical protein n=1 Tax=unclassified Mycoplasma TaxID=2683645 RepID=UPI003AAB145C
MKKLKNILYLTALATVATFPMVSSSCDHKDEKSKLDERLELNGQSLYKNTQLAMRYNELKTSNVQTITNINSLFSKINSDFNKKISLNASVYIDWEKVEKILQYNEKYSNEKWFVMLVKNLYDVLSDSDNVKEFHKIVINNDDSEYSSQNDPYNTVFKNTNNNLANIYILNNYINYILDIVQSYKQYGTNKNAYWISNIENLLKKLIVPSAYIIDPKIVKDNSEFLKLKNYNLWDIFLNMKKYSDSKISAFDFLNGDFTEIYNTSDYTTKPSTNHEWINFKPIPIDSTDMVINLTDILTSWKNILKYIDSQEEYSLVNILESKITKENNSYKAILKIKMPDKAIRGGYNINSKDIPYNSLDVKLDFNNLLPLTFSSFKKAYGEIISSAVVYILSINNTNEMAQKWGAKEINSSTFKYIQIERDVYSYNFFTTLYNYVENIKNNQVKLELALPVTKLNDDHYKGLQAQISDNELPIFYKFEEIKM